jgi:Co/Zn/Cd efflux system component
MVVLSQNIAFVSFLAFTALQFFFAFIAKSQSMLTDCSAMSVDVVSYFVNYLAEKLKDGRQERTMLYLELFPPVFSVITLVIVTAVALDQAITTLSDPNPLLQQVPSIGLMLLFSSLNLILDKQCLVRLQWSTEPMIAPVEPPTQRPVSTPNCWEPTEYSVTKTKSHHHPLSFAI